LSDATRLDTIEIKLAHLERGLQDLSDVVTRQQRELELALARNQRLAGRLEELEGAGASATAFEKPPHY
jgi:SlyX protein